jgi:hypothetical protein
MANKRILRLTNTEALVKVDGVVGSVTIGLATDLLLPHEEVVGTPKVNIAMMQVSGKTGSVMSVERDGENLYDLQAGSAECIDLFAIGAASDNTNNDSDIVVTSSGAEGQLILKLRKVSGYQTKIRPEQTGSDEVQP